MYIVREDILTSDISGMMICEDILTTKGGKTSHASVVAKKMNKFCIIDTNYARDLYNFKTNRKKLDLCLP